MLAIRMQRTGRSGHAMFRMVVQDSRLTPTSGKVVAYLGSYDPHAKVVSLEKDKAAMYLNNGARPSERVARLMRQQGVELPAWVKLPTEKHRSVRHPDKLRRNQPPKAAEPAAAEAAVPSEPAAAPTTEQAE